MTLRDGRPWLPVALLLLQVPGCWCLSGPTSVMGIVSGSLSVQCQYEEKFREMAKYWCKSPCVWSTVKTKGADRKESNGRVSIRDHPANLTFTVTLENLTEDDAGTYRCGIDISWFPVYLLDPTFLVVVSVTPETDILSWPPLRSDIHILWQGTSTLYQVDVWSTDMAEAMVYDFRGEIINMLCFALSKITHCGRNSLPYHEDTKVVLLGEELSTPAKNDVSVSSLKQIFQASPAIQ
ncbi:PREDICTED: CMRF35-like molecule 6 [Odobenus rosmarus divergens]|uniref:CMRF35-like molecule 6 n=1 Tax=Odobenus rosmarus divergens TaxID=9708 RepID=A0A9B0LE87_ODORO